MQDPRHEYQRLASSDHGNESSLPQLHEGKLAEAFESVSDAFYAVDRQWRFIYVNRRAQELWARSQEELLGKNIWEEFPQAVGSESYQKINQAMEEGVTTEFETVSPVLGTWIAGRVYPFPDGLSVYFQDITERKRTEETLRESEERYRKLFDSIDEGFAIIEMLYDEQDQAVDYRILETNPAFGRMTGFADAAGKTSLELNPDAEPYWFEILGRVAKTGEDVRFESYAEALDRWFDVYASRVGGEESRRVAIVFADTTERKRAEEERDHMRAREIEARTQKEERRRIARDLHDVVLQDLAGVLQSLRLIYLQSKGSESGLDLEEELEALGRATLGLRGAVHDLRGENERAFVKSVESLVELNRRLTPDCNIELIVEEGFPNRLGGEVGGELLRVIREALTNARHHSGAKRVVVTLKVEGDDLVVEISDDGQGFDPEATPGVGLSSMRERAAKVDGRLEIESEVGLGTSVRLLMPVQQKG